MTPLQPRSRRKSPILFTVALCLIFCTLNIFGQSRPTSNGFTLQFLKGSTDGSVDQVASNVVKVVNNTGRTVVFNLEYAYPAGWRIMNDKERVYSVANRDSLFVPVRVIPTKAAEGNVNYFVNASAFTASGVPLASAPWNMQVTKVSRWFANIVKSEAYLPNDSDETSFQLNVKNDGNSAEDVVVLFNPDPKLLITDAQGNPFGENTLQLKLPVDTDTLLTFKAKLQEGAGKENFFSAGPIDEVVTDKVDFQVSVQVKDVNNKTKSWGGRVHIKKLPSEVKIKSEAGTATIPLKVQFNTYNILSQFTNFSLDLSGDADLGRDRYLRYYYQTIISSNSIAGTQFLGSYRFGEFRTPKYTIAVGDLGANMELLLNGTGVRASYKLGKVDVSGIYVKRPQSGLVNNELTSMGGSVRLNTGKRVVATAQVVNQIDEFNEIDKKLGTVEASYRFRNQSLASVKVGYSMENHGADSTFTVPGMGITAKYVGRIKSVSFSSQLRYNTPSYSSQYRGTKSINSNARYTINQKYFLGFRVNVNTRTPEIYSKGVLFPVRYYKYNTYELRFGWTTEAGNFVFSPKVYDEEFLDVRTMTTGAGITFSTNKASSIRFFSRFYSGFTKAKDYDLDPYLVNRWENSLRYKNLNFSVRYYYGPYNVLDNLRVIEDGINPQSIYMSTYATLNFKEARLSVRPTFTMSYESVMARWRMNLAPQLIYYSKSGFEFKVAVEYFNVNQGESPLATVSENPSVFSPFAQSNTFLRFGLTKQFNIKKPGKKSHELEVVVFKDLNGNNLRDSGEEYEQNVIVRVNGETLMTNEEGRVIFKDLPQEKYLVETEMLSNSEGWFKSKGIEVDLNKDQALYIPLKRGVQINGNVILQQAQYSALGEGGMKLDGIRVTAEGEDGQTYSGLTDLNGIFRIYVPFGEYKVRVNQNAVDQQFEFAQSEYNVVVNNVSVNYQLTFYLIEKRRRLNIKKFDN